MKDKNGDGGYRRGNIIPDLPAIAFILPLTMGGWLVSGFTGCCTAVVFSL
jgi:hypothetical protein